jgi:tRNA threonylcarbamoyladenosine biosynthesis protein TsaB
MNVDENLIMNHEQSRPSEAVSKVDTLKVNALLCIETSGTVCGVALAECQTSAFGEKPLEQSNSVRVSMIAELSFFEPHQHDHLLAEATQTLLRLTNRSMSHIQAVAVSSGPGSFTGLRIGAAFAKALTFDDSADPASTHLLAVPTMTAIAYAARQAAQMLAKSHILVAIPSHKNLVYVQEYSIDAVPTTEIRLLAAETLLAQADTFYAGTYFADVSLPDKSTITQDFTTLPDLCRVTPRMIAEYAVVLFQKQVFTPSAEFVPLYAQEFVPKTVGSSN